MHIRPLMVVVVLVPLLLIGWEPNFEHLHLYIILWGPLVINPWQSSNHELAVPDPNFFNADLWPSLTIDSIRLEKYKTKYCTVYNNLVDGRIFCSTPKDTLQLLLLAHDEQISYIFLVRVEDHFAWLVLNLFVASLSFDRHIFMQATGGGISATYINLASTMKVYFGLTNL